MSLFLTRITKNIPIKTKAFFIFLFITLCVTSFWFSRVHEDEFYYIHDQQIYLSFGNLVNELFLRNSDNFGTASGIGLIMGFWDKLFYLTGYSLGLSTKNVEFITFSLSLFFSLFFSYLGFFRLRKLFNWSIPEYVLYSLAFFYTFNAYTLIFWHTGNLSLNMSFVYSLFPLFVSYLWIITESKLSARDLITFMIILFFMSFYFTLLGVVITFVICFLLIKILLGEFNFKIFLRNAFLCLLVYAPLTLCIAVPILYDYFDRYMGLLTSNVTFKAEPLNLMGSVITPMLMRFSWAIQKDWELKHIFTFSDFFFSPTLIVSCFVLYAVLTIFLIKRKKEDLDSFVLSFLLFLILCFIFAKGAQRPFGAVYTFFHDNVSFFNMFRNPDSKFGFGIIASTILLFLWISSKTTKHIKLTLLIIVLSLIQGYPVIIGEAVRGKDRDTGVDMIVSIPSDYKKIAAIVQKDANPVKTVMMLPAVSYGYYPFSDSSKILGKDIFSNVLEDNVVLLEQGYGMYDSLKQVTESELAFGETRTTQGLGITHLLVKDYTKLTKFKILNPNLDYPNLEILYKDNLQTLYKVKNPMPLIHGPELGFQKISPIKYKIRILNLKEPKVLRFLNTYHAGWGIYLTKYANDINDIDLSLLESADLSYFRKEVLTKNIKADQSIFNTWSLNPSLIKFENSPEFYHENPDGSINFDLVMFFTPQSYAYVAGIASFLVLFLYLFLLVVLPKKNVSK